MYLANLPFAQVTAELGDRKDIVAAIKSSPSSTVVSGAVAPLAEYVEKLRERCIPAFRVDLDVAFHSPMLEWRRLTLFPLLLFLKPKKATKNTLASNQSRILRD